MILESLYRPIEVWLEGAPTERRRRNASGPKQWTRKDWRIKLGKWTLFLLLSLIIAHTFVAYFVSVPRLFEMIRHHPTENWSVFAWMTGVTTAVYINFASFREQMCLVVCPYGRMQSILTDSDTIVVGYDQIRGEPRGKLKGRDTTSKEPPQGDCIDCNRCVTVCPTGIDIRNGLQIECIGCSACIDACDSIMDKVNKPRGLIRYDSFMGFDDKPKRFWRPRVFLYVLAGTAGLVALATAWQHSDPFVANVLRLDGPPFAIVDEQIQNAYNIHIENKRANPLLLTLGSNLPTGYSMVTPIQKIKLPPSSGSTIPVFLRIPKTQFSGDMSIEVVLFDGQESHQLLLRFLGPSQ